MSLQDLPLILEPSSLEPLLGAEGLIIIDLCKPETYAQIHVPGARFLDYSQIVEDRKPVFGLLPDTRVLEQRLSNLGVGNGIHVVAYDDEGGGRAARLLWTLEVLGHRRYSLLNGGLHAWVKEGHPIERQPNTPTTLQFAAAPDREPVADRAYIQTRLGESDFKLLDARSQGEYTGARRFSKRGGHIPGAVNLDWQLVMDQARNLRLKAPSTLESMLLQLGIEKAHEVVTYCQSHHRSSLTYIVLKSLGYRQIKGYPGSWSDWGNHNDTPIEPE